MIYSYEYLQKQFKKVKHTSYKRTLKIKRLENKIKKLEEELETCKQKIKEQDIMLGWLWLNRKE